jgi:hypothetical protein
MSLATAARRLQAGALAVRNSGFVALVAAVLALAGSATCRADGQSDWRFPTVDDPGAVDGQSYSYYYVPHLSELNQLVGYLFRSGLVRMDAADRDAGVTRYAAYSCEGTLYAGGGPGPGTVEDVDWSQVTGLHTGPVSDPASLVVERGPSRDGAVKPLVLYVPDSRIRYHLHQALAVLVSECRPKPGRAGRSTPGH